MPEEKLLDGKIILSWVATIPTDTFAKMSVEQYMKDREKIARKIQSVIQSQEGDWNTITQKEIDKEFPGIKFSGQVLLNMPGNGNREGR